MNFYNEIDDYCCDWLENLIRERLIPDGIIDRRSIVDILPADLNGFTQCHFFAGLGGWPLSLRRADFPDSRKVWTGSCPCQPFSSAGKRAGFTDARHLWPSWFKLIKACRPELIFGEQVASAKTWMYKVKFDLEHVSMSDAGREALYGLQTDEILAGFPRLSRPWYLRAAALMQALPEGLREEVAQFLKRVSQDRAHEEARKGQALQVSVDGEESGGISDSRMPPALRPEEHTIRFESMGVGDRRENKAWTLRGNGFSSVFESGQRASSEQCVSGSDRFEEGISVQKHPSGMLGGQHGTEQLGRGRSEANHQGVGEKINEQSSFAGTFREEPSPSVEGKRLVRGDLEALGYPVGIMPVEAASAGADHLRDRFWFVADGDGERLAQRPQQHERAERSGQQAPFGHDPLRSGFRTTFDLGNGDLARAHADSKEGSSRGSISEPGARGYEWVIGADGKARRVESGICLLTHALSGRVAVRRTVRRADAEIEEEHWYSRVRSLKALGNAIDPRPAAAFIRAALDY